MKWIVGGVVALALAGRAVVVFVPLKSPPPSPPPDTRVTLRLEPYHYCELRLIASLPKETDLDVRALRRGRRSSTGIGLDTFRVVGMVLATVIACLSPAIRATRADPLEILRAT